MTDSPSDSPPTAALAPEEWDALPESITLYNYAPPALSRHSVAALCLYEQPFGFSHAELKALTSSVNAERPLICSDDAHDETDYEPLAASAVAKIRAQSDALQRGGGVIPVPDYGNGEDGGYQHTTDLP